MQIRGVLINADGDHLGGSLANLEGCLALFRSAGFDGVEISAHGLDVISGGRLRRAQVDRVRAILERYPFRYTVHGADQTNFAFPGTTIGGTDSSMDRAVFVADLDFCAEIHAPVMVYHSGLISLYPAATGLGALPDDEELARAREREAAALRELAPLAAERGVVVAMENRDPHPWEIAVLRHFGLPPEKLPKYHAGMMVPDLVAQVKAVGHPNVGLTLDLGHLYLAANQCGFDFLEAVRQAAPYARHVHASDNWGRLGGPFDSLNHRIPHGEGDVHMPPGWGGIPHVEALRQMPQYEGYYLVEIRPRFYEHAAEARQTAQRLVAEATDGRGP